MENGLCVCLGSGALGARFQERAASVVSAVGTLGSEILSSLLRIRLEQQWPGEQ